MIIKKLHFISGIILTIFVGLHLFNHLCSLAGIAQHLSVMKSLRIIYRNIFVESILLAAVVSQVISGTKLLRTAQDKVYNMQKISGLYLAFFLMIHVSVILAGRYILHLDTNFYFGAAGLNTFPFNLFFIPYYALAILAFFAHLAAVHRTKMRYPILDFIPKQQSRGFLWIGALLTALILYGLTNHFKGIEIPKPYWILILK